MKLEERLKSLNKRGEENQEKRLAEEQMDFWPDDKRAAPNSMVRCALFRAALASKSGSRKMHRNTPLPSLGNEEVFYSGDDLDQKDMDVWMAVLQLFREKPVGDVVRVSSNQLLILSGLSNSGTSHEALKQRLDRLTFAHIRLNPTDPSSKYSFHGSLLQRAERSDDGKVWEISLAPRLKLLFTEGYTWVDWEIRNSLKRSPMAQWLHSFYRSHKEPLPLTTEKLHKMCGSQSQEMRFFRNDLKKAFRRLEQSCSSFGVTIEWKHDKKSDKFYLTWVTRETQRHLPPKG